VNPRFARFAGAANRHQREAGRGSRRAEETNPLSREVVLKHYLGTQRRRINRSILNVMYHEFLKSAVPGAEERRSRHGDPGGRR
jgi:hypothetical protein